MVIVTKRRNILLRDAAGIKRGEHMSRSSCMKKERQAILLEKLEQDPFLTDEELSEMLGVSVPTIRLDRLELGIPELRERIKNVAQKNYSKVNLFKLKI